MRRRLRLVGLVCAGLLAAGCGEAAPEPATSPSLSASSSSSSSSSSASSPAPTSASAPPTRAEPEATSVTVSIAKGRVQTASRRVKVARGAKVRITVTSDIAEEFHLHGYDRSMKLAPGRPATLDLTAEVPGVFEAELHGSGARLFELQVG